MLLKVLRILEAILIGVILIVTIVKYGALTKGHVCYYVTQDTDKIVFTGDTLFLGGCGRFFEGTAEQMYEALVNKLGKLPPDTKVSSKHSTFN